MVTPAHANKVAPVPVPEEELAVWETMHRRGSSVKDDKWDGTEDMIDTKQRRSLPPKRRYHYFLSHVMYLMVLHTNILICNASRKRHIQSKGVCQSK